MKTRAIETKTVIGGANSVGGTGSASGATKAPRGAFVAPDAGGSGGPAILVPDPEVPEKKARRKFTAKYKLSVLSEADGCTEPGQIGALLRREGLYSSHLTKWRRQRDDGILNAMGPKKRGRKPIEPNPLIVEVASLQKRNRKLEERLRQAELIIEAQKKISEILDTCLGNGKSSS